MLATPRVGEVVLAGDVELLYGLLRLLIPDPVDQEEALVGVLARATRADAGAEPHGAANGNGHANANGNGNDHHRGEDTRGGLDRGALKALILEQIAADPHVTWAGDEAVLAAPAEPEERPPLHPETLAGVNDKTLGALVRTLPLPQRQALVLRLVCGIDPRDVARALGREPGEVEALTGRGVDSIEAHLLEHQERDAELRRELWEANPYRLRPTNGMSALGGPQANFNTVVKGVRVYATLPPKHGPLSLLVRALKAVARLFTRHEQELDLDDDVGDRDSPRSPGATPGQKKFEQPKRTPSLTDYRLPRLSPGVAVYAMPRSTPATQRLSNPTRPIERQTWGTTKGRTFLSSSLFGRN